MPRVLVVDDSKVIQVWCSKAFKSIGYDTDVASDGREAIDKLPSFFPNVILLDLIMPRMDGYQTLQYLLNRHIDTPVIVMSTQPVAIAEPEMKRLGASAYLQKPLTIQSIQAALHQIFGNKKEEQQPLEIREILESPADQPWEVMIKTCYVCGYDQVRVFCSKPNSFKEDWDAGISPHFSPIGKYLSWDFLKTKVSVCPSCLFASKNHVDFADRGKNLNYPHKIDAKKILASGISGRRKLVSTDIEAKEDHRFDTHLRDVELVIQSFRLAEKCANGLILGDKMGAYADLGYYILMQGVLDKNKIEARTREALGSYYDQLKVKEIPREMTIMCYYFVITLHIALGESIKANEQKEALEQFYRLNDPDEASNEERLWNQRLVHIWRNGADLTNIRELK